MTKNTETKIKKTPPLKKISANEINRYVYCPYQWYYGKYYGQTKLKEQYKALNKNKGATESNFIKGTDFHKNYYKKYERRRMLQIALVLIVLSVIIGGIVIWWQ